MNKILSKLSKYSFYICIIVIGYLATTTQEIQAIKNSWDKANHFIAFMVLYILLSLGYRDMQLFKKVAILFVIALQIEIVQYFIPGRDFSWLDVIADMIGLGIGWILLMISEQSKSFTLR